MKLISVTKMSNIPVGMDESVETDPALGLGKLHRRFGVSVEHQHTLQRRRSVVEAPARSASEFETAHSANE